jgi:hypothetical protein
MDLSDIFRICHTAVAPYTFFFGAHRIFSKIYNIFGRGGKGRKGKRRKRGKGRKKERKVKGGRKKN